MPPAPTVPPMADFGSGYRFHITGLLHDESGFPTGDRAVAARLLQRLHDKVAYRQAEITFTEAQSLDDAEVAVFAYGSPARAAERAVKEARARGIKAGLLKSMTLWPFPAAAVRQLASRVRAIVVPEMNLGQLVGEVERAAAGAAVVRPLSRLAGELFTPADILAALEEVGS